MNPEEKVGAVLVIGGGIGGIQAALDLAESGYKVYLVEQSPAIGGVMAQLDKTFPTNDCSMCILSPKLVECGRHLNIEIMACSEVLDIKGEAGNFEVLVAKHPRYIDLQKCTGCGDCAEVCPVEVSSEFDQGLVTRKAIYRPFAQAFPSAFAIDKRGQSPCKLACPAGVNVPGYIALISQGKFKEALDIVRNTLPFPAICGSVCHHPCEEQCNRKDIDEPVSTRLLHKLIADWARENGEEPAEAIQPARQERVVIIGAGPSGLTCALRLVEKGYPVTILEASDKAGGMIASCIPDYRNRKEIANYEIGRVLAYGMELKTNTKVGRDITIEELRKEYKAIYIGIGAQDPARLPVEGAEAKGVLYGLPFLRDVKSGKKVKDFGQRVIVIGGGNVAIDCAKSAIRVGAKSVHLVCLETRDLTSKDRMPAHVWEIEEAEEEGVAILGSLGPRKILSQNGKTTGLETQVCTSVYEDDGRFRPKFSEEAGPTIEADTVIIAIGQRPDLTGFEDLEKTPQRTIKVDEITLETSIPGIFAGGDIVRGPASVIEAVAHGNEAAESIDRFLNGVDLKEGRAREVQVAPLPEAEVEKKGRAKIQKRDPRSRVKGFEEIELGFAQEGAETVIEEGKRCLNCAVCSECMQCIAACKAEAVAHNMTEELVKIQVGSVILCPGFDKFDPSSISNYGYGKYRNVVTSIEFERILSASGPYQGELARPSDKKLPGNIAWIQCVGSRDVLCDKAYCSSVCCTYAIKEAIVAKEHAPFDLDTTIFFMDIRTYGKGFDEYYNRAREEYGVRFIRSKVYGIHEVDGTGNLSIRYAAEDGKITNEEFDLVVLSVGFEPPQKAIDLAKRLGIRLNGYGFCQTDEFSPVQTSKPGIFVCGAFQGPKDIPETVMQASAAAANSSLLLSSARNTLVIEKEYPPERDVTGESPRIGVFICRCGINIAGTVDVPGVKDYAATLPNVVFADENLYTCSQDTQQQIKEKIEEHNLNRVVVASCSPRTLEPLFQETIREGGLNRFLFEMANIRDQCSWVHLHESEKATQKAKDLIRMAVGRAALLEPLHKVTLGLSHEALVIGGGVAGMTVALNLAEQGFRTCLVEREKELGGWVRRIYTSVQGEDAQHFLRSLIERVKANELIEVLTGTNVVKCEGFVGNFKTTLALEDGERQRLVEHGVTIIATGAKEYRGQEFLLGQEERVLTLGDFEEKLAQAPEEMAQAKDVVMILCVRPPEGSFNYCSRICCTSAIKNAIKLKEINPEANIYILYKDIRTYGFKEELYTKAREEGVLFIRYSDERPPQVHSVDGKLQVDVIEPILNEELALSPDLLVLAMPIMPSETNEELSRILKVPLTKEGFFHEAHVKLAPVDFASEGIFMCGTAHSPKFIDETIAQAQAAAGRATTILAKEQLEVGGAICQVDGDRCKACLSCVRVCPYGVPYINQEGVAEIEVVKCRGCGICAAECPRKAIELLHYRENQVEAKTEALLVTAGR